LRSCWSAGTKGQISEDTVEKIAESVGLDVNWFKQDMASPEILQALRANVALAHALNIHCVLPYPGASVAGP
jgi:predicted DsbA family dithiol-disulfide isomerase